METDLTLREAWKKETAREVFNLVWKSFLMNKWIIFDLNDLTIKMIMRTKFALRQITLLPESVCGDIALEIVEEEANIIRAYYLENIYNKGE